LLMRKAMEPSLDLDGWWQEHRAMAAISPGWGNAAAVHMQARTPPRGKVEWPAIPRETLGAALTLLADDIDSPFAAQTLASAAKFAPRLVARDLTLAHVLLTDRTDRFPVHAPTVEPSS
jgi:hypothetical protein